MASKPDIAYTPLLQPTVAQVAPQECDELRPTKGLRFLLRMSVTVLVMTTVNLAVQIYTATLFSSSGSDMYLLTPSSAIWAAAIALCAALYMTIVARSALHGMRHAKVHMVFGLIACGLACTFLFTGMVMSAVTSSNFAALAPSSNSRYCVYHDESGHAVYPPTTASYSCDECGQSEYSPSYFSPRSCCCCSGNEWYDAMTFYGVGSCDDVLDHGYAVSVISCLLYGLSLVVTFTICITTCVVGCCRCYSWSEMCGPFSMEGGVCCKNTSYARSYAPYPVVAIPQAPQAQNHPPGTNPSYGTMVSVPSITSEPPLAVMHPGVRQGVLPSYTGSGR